MPQVSRNIPHGSELEKNILEELKQRVKRWNSDIGEKLGKWREAEDKTLAYLPETETMRRRKSRRAQGEPDYTTIQVPYSYAVTLSALTYVTSVFFGRNPIFQFSGRHGETEQQSQALEAVIDYQVVVGQMLPYLYTLFYDMFKYGHGTVCLHWDEKVELISDLQEQPAIDPNTGMITMQSVPIEVPMRTYAGNRLFNVQPQDFVWDTSYPLRDFQKGSFAGRRFSITWNDVVRRQKNGFYINTEHITDQSKDLFGRDMGSDQLMRPDSLSGSEDVTDFQKQWKHPSKVSGYEICVELIPKEWQLSASDWPQKWVFSCTEDFKILIGAQPQGAWHASYPYAVIPLEPEGYGLTTRGLPETLDPIQSTIDWLVNSHFFNIRAALNNRVVVDPSRVVMKDLLTNLPGGIVRLKPEAYGTDTKLALTQLQITDVTQQHLPNTQWIMQMGERMSGVNDQMMSMVDTGGRKTATEVRTSTSFGVNRLKMISEFASVSGIEPLARMMVQNTQQYYDMQMKFKIAGSLLAQAGQGFIMVDPQTVAGSYDFVPVDGTLPIDRFAQVNLWKELMQSATQVPMIGMQYDWAGIFQWVAQLAGLKNITQFKIEVAPDQMLMMQAMMGNSIPMGGNAGGKPRSGLSDTKQGYQQPIQAQQQPMTNGAM